MLAETPRGVYRGLAHGTDEAASLNQNLEFIMNLSSVNKSNIIDVLEALLECAPESGRWVIGRLTWSAVSQVVSLTADLRGSKHPAAWVEPQRDSMLGFLGALMEMTNMPGGEAAASVEGHVAYLEHKGASGFRVAENSLEMMKAAGIDDETIAEFMQAKADKMAQGLGVKQRAIKNDREGFKAECEALVTNCRGWAVSSQGLDKEMALGTQQFFLQAIERSLIDRRMWLMSNVLTQAGELMLVAGFIKSGVVDNALMWLEQVRQEAERAGYDGVDAPVEGSSRTYEDDRGYDRDGE